MEHRKHIADCNNPSDHTVENLEILKAQFHGISGNVVTADPVIKNVSSNEIVELVKPEI